MLRVAAMKPPFASARRPATAFMGTCRMGTDPKTSVVDARLRLHRHHNCFVFGSAV